MRMLQHYTPFVRLAITGLLILCLICHTGSVIINCYQGAGASITRNFPNDSQSTCQANTSNSEFCLEARFLSWHTDNDSLVTELTCGKCNYTATKLMGVECRECQTDLCNDGFGRDLARRIQSKNLKSCYGTVTLSDIFYPEPIFCPANEDCVAGNHAEFPLSPIVGCQHDCKEKNLTNCEYCSGELCNTQSRIVTIEEWSNYTAFNEPKTENIASDVVVVKVGALTVEPSVPLTGFAPMLLAALSLFQPRPG